MLDIEELEIDRLNRADELGKKAVTILVTLHGGACIALLGFLSNASTNAVVTLSVFSVRLSLSAFLIGISSVLLALLFSYTFYAMPPETGWSKFWNRNIVLTNGVLGTISLLSFIVGVGSLILGAQSLQQP